MRRIDWRALEVRQTAVRVSAGQCRRWRGKAPVKCSGRDEARAKPWVGRSRCAAAAEETRLTDGRYFRATSRCIASRTRCCGRGPDRGSFQGRLEMMDRARLLRRQHDRQQRTRSLLSGTIREDPASQIDTIMDADGCTKLARDEAMESSGLLPSSLTM